MKIIFMGTPDFSVPALKALAAAGHEIICVYTQPPRPAGRREAHQERSMRASSLPSRPAAMLRSASCDAARARSPATSNR